MPHHDLAHVRFCDRTQAMLDEGEADKPAREARLWLRSHPRDPDAFIVLGQAAQLNGDWRGSLSFLQAAYAANPLYRNVSQGWADDSRRFLHRFPNVHLRRVTVHRGPSAALQAKAGAMLLARQYDALDAMQARLLRSRARIGSTWAATDFADVLWNSLQVKRHGVSTMRAFKRGNGRGPNRCSRASRSRGLGLRVHLWRAGRKWLLQPRLRLFE